MAAVLPLLGDKLQSFTAGASDDPIGWLTRTLMKFGTAILIAGFAIGTIGYFLKAAATTAANNEKAVIGNIGTIFSNIKAPSFSAAPSGTAPVTASLQGVQNFFSDAWQDIQGAASDVAQIGAALGTLAEDVGVGLADVAKALLAFILHFPDILWNGLVWGIGGAIADLLNWVFPWFVILGAALIVTSLVIHGARLLWDRTLGAAWRSSSAKWLERRKESAERVFDRVFHNRPAPRPIEMPVLPPLPEVPPAAPDVPMAGLPAFSGGPVDSAGGEVSPGSKAEALPAIPEPTPELPPMPAPEDLPLQEPPTQKELEKELGDGYTRAKDRMRAVLRGQDQAVSPTAASA